MKLLNVVVSAALLLALATGPACAARLDTHSLVVDGRTRTYNVYLPSSYSSKQPLPVVIMLHGAGATGTGVIGETAWDKKADRQGFLVVFPDAVRSDPTSPPGFLTNPQLWNDGSGRGQSFLGGVDDVKFLNIMLADLAKKYAVDTKAVFLTGFSNGASLAFRAAALLPDKFAAIAPVAGPYWPPQSTPSHRPRVPTLFIAGTADPYNPLGGGPISHPWGTFTQPPLLDGLREWTVLNGCDNGLVPAAGRQGIRSLACATLPMRVYLVEGLGHLWPGGTPQFPASYIGTDPGTMPATDVIWEFFAAVRAQSR
ncbi:alpha/beta hydrolase family esterase [Anaeroselena agilis]|uniref:Alpha/beta hydrolase-fold protein n=1 Tax=Anaeroselena agilis TaxID=3063788 RepID=A0ABU3P4J5_9FIRM|nr:alpha/beta hydrolase-fold protein [Selenomonadales bacterium 4137-cl]